MAPNIEMQGGAELGQEQVAVPREVGGIEAAMDATARQIRVVVRHGRAPTILAKLHRILWKSILYRVETRLQDATRAAAIFDQVEPPLLSVMAGPAKITGVKPGDDD